MIEFINKFTCLNVDNLLNVVDFLAVGLLPYKKLRPTTTKYGAAINASEVKFRDERGR